MSSLPVNKRSSAGIMSKSRGGHSSLIDEFAGRENEGENEDLDEVQHDELDVGNGVE